MGIGQVKCQIFKAGTILQSIIILSACLLPPNLTVALSSTVLSTSGTLLSHKWMHTGITVHLCLHLCEHHRCRATVDKFGLHPLICHCCTGHFPWPTTLNDIVRRGSNATGFPSQIEPVSLKWGDSKQPDGLRFSHLKVTSFLYGISPAAIHCLVENLVTPALSLGLIA